MSRSCVYCGAGISEDASPLKQFCSDSCKKKLYYRRKKAKEAVQRLPEVANGVKQMRDLDALALEGGDPIYAEYRKLLSDALRTNISQYVQDQLLGSGEILAGMVPKALAILSDEMDSENDYVRSRAVAATMKYAMAFKGQEGDKENLGTINVVHNMGTTVPDTALGHATIDASDRLRERGELQQAAIEAGDLILEPCGKCGEPKHPDTLRLCRDGDNMRVCSSCWLQITYRDGRLDPSAYMGHDPEFGID